MLLSAVPNPAYMNGTLGIDNTVAGMDALNTALAQYAAAGGSMQGFGIDNTPAGRRALRVSQAQYAAANRASRLMHGTLAIDEPEPAYAAAAAAGGGRFSLNSGLATHGQDADSMGMGTTGSLGVNYAAPLTRGGFAGEIFDDAPMPTGNWQDAPTPVMLGTEAAPSMNLVTKLTLIATLLYVGYKLLDLGGKAQPASARSSQASRRLRSRTQRIALANK